MNKQEAKEILLKRGVLHFMSTNDTELLTAITIATEALQDDWIPVSERLPEKSKQVMCCDKQGRVFTSAMTHINSNGEPSFGKHYGVIAWQPLPDAYEGGEEE